MATRKSPRKIEMTLLLVEADVLVRHALAEHLRACDITVIEAVNADDAKSILIAGPAIDVLLSDSQLAGEGSGFVLAQWVRRHRANIDVRLTASLESKVLAAAEIVAQHPDCKPTSDATKLAAKLNGMLAERKRRLRQQPKSAPARRKRQRA